MVEGYAELFFLLCLVGLLTVLWRRLREMNQGEPADPAVEYTDQGGMAPGPDDADGDGRTTLAERLRRD
ncbi:hypothetical protein [Haloarchaeobius amylolyticus]|uniref:hypothetical protein n=1 Tax=Haloarchaeobius amylolyticus TaxID=1198296 RepID=UPI00226E5ECA|nr:hypothetical protein [Haloarchaeobius amylolyticus]